MPAIGPSRRRQLGAFRGELSRALALDAFRPARDSLTTLLDVRTLQRYFDVAESGELRDRLVGGGRPPTSRATNQARRDCVDLLLSAARQPRLQTAAPPWGRDPATRPPVALRPTPQPGELAELRGRLGDALSAQLDPGQARFTAMVAMVLDTAARAGELAGQQLADLHEDMSHVTVRRRPQHSTAAVALAGPDVLPLSTLTTRALRQWLPARGQLTAPPARRGHRTVGEPAVQPHRPARRPRPRRPPPARPAAGGQRPRPRLRHRPPAIRARAPAPAQDGTATPRRHPHPHDAP